MINITISGIKELDRMLANKTKQTQKALNTAMRRQGFLLRQKLQEEIREGAPGGLTFEPWRYITLWHTENKKKILTGAARWSGGPLRRLGGRWIRYHVESNEPFVLKIGWVGVPGNIKKRAAQHQQGFTSPVSSRLRRILIQRGIKRKEIEGDLPKGMGVARYHFLKKSTTTFRTPARPVIEPFWRAHKAESWQNIRKNFRLKMRGETLL
jgi:hypothetical protein